MIRCRRLHRDSYSKVGPVDPVDRTGDDMKGVTLNPWRRASLSNLGLRGTIDIETINPSMCPFNAYDVNKGPDVYTKMAVLKVSPSIVSLISYSGGKQVFWGSGVIFQSFWKNDSLYYFVLTSATLLRPPPSHGSDNHPAFDICRGEEPDDQDFLPIQEKIDVYLKGGNLCEGSIVTYDPHYNIAVLIFKSDIRLPCAVLKPLDDSLALSNAPLDAQASACHLSNLPVKLISGDVVIAVGRYPQKNFRIMEAPGTYRADCFDKNIKLNCMELLRADCKITKHWRSTY